MASNPISPASAHTNGALANFASAYSNSKFIADLVCPVIPVDKESDTFYKRLRKDVETALDAKLGARGSMNEASYDLDDDTYQVNGYGLKEAVDYSLQTNADAPIDPKRWATQNVMQRLMLAREIRVADLIMSAGSWAASNTSAAGDPWTDATNGTPVDDILTAQEAIPSDGEESRLVGVCSLEVFHALRKHPQVRDLHGMETGQLKAAQLADYLELDELHVSRVFKNTANTGQTRSSSRVWSATAFAIVQVPTQLMSTQQQVFAVTFRKNQPAGGAINVREWHEPAEGYNGTDFVAAEHKDDEKVIQDDQGYLITGVRS